MVCTVYQLLMRLRADIDVFPRFGLESAEEMAEWVVDHYGVSSGSEYPTMLDGQSKPSYNAKIRFCRY